MKPFQITFINALVLIVLGLWGYFDSRSFTALIPVFAGALFLLLARGMRESNRITAHITVFLTLVILIALIKPLTGSLSRNDNAAAIRVIIMMASCVFALAVYIKSFVDARKQRSRIS